MEIKDSARIVPAASVKAGIMPATQLIGIHMILLI